MAGDLNEEPKVTPDMEKQTSEKENAPKLNGNAEETDKTTSDIDTTDPAISDKGVVNTVDLEKQAGQAAATPGVADENVVFWDGDNDPDNPYNWPSWLKVSNCVLVSSLTFLTPLGSSMFAPGVPELMREFGSKSSILGSFVVSIYVLGFAAGPMVFAPLSEIYGRLPVYHTTNWIFFAFNIGCALAPSLNSLLGFRFLAGLFGSVVMANGGGTIADMIHQENRGAAMSAFAIGPLLGPIIGPVVGGFVSQSLGWRWVFWIICMLSGVLNTIFFIFARETYAPILIERKTKKLRKSTGNTQLRSKLDPNMTPADFFKQGILRPCKMLIYSPICQIASLYVAIAYAYMYLLFASMTPLFMQVYQFSQQQAGLAFLGLGVGCMTGVIVFSSLSDRYLKKKAAEEKAAAEAEGREPEPAKPEYRLPPLRIGACFLPAGFFIYGWTADYAVHWIAPIIGTCVVGVAQLLIFMPLQMHLVDSFNIYAASALASNSLIRSIAGAFLPMAAFPMYNSLGIGWGNSLLGFLALALVPVPWLLLKYGEYLRKTFPVPNL